MKKTFIIFLISLWMGSCGVYSSLRPGDTLKQGKVEISGGLSASMYGEVLPVAQVALGALNWLEILGHYEMQSGYGGVRFGVLKSDKHGIGLSIGGQAGWINRYESDNGDLFALEYNNRFAYGPSFSIGRKFKHFEPYISAMAFFDESGIAVGSEKIGLRWYISPKFIWGLELGSAQHAKLFSSSTNDGIATFEGATFLSFQLN